MLKKIIYVSSINIIILLVILLGIECTSRFISVSEGIAPIFNDQTLRIRGRPFVVQHEKRGFALKEGFKNFIYSINNEGFRGEDFPSNLSNKYRVVALGESTTFGWGVHENETYPYYLYNAIENPNVYVINGGIPSYTSSQVLAYLDEIIKKDKVRPDMILLNILWNDIWYSSIKNWHSDILIYQKPPEWMIFLMEHSVFINKLLMGNDGNLVNIKNAPALKKYSENIEKIIQLCQKYQIKIVLIQPPFDGSHMPEEGLNEFQVRYSKEFFINTAREYIAAMEAIALKYKVNVIHHSLDIRNLNQSELFLDILHPTAKGNAIMAKDIYNQIQSWGSPEI